MATGDHQKSNGYKRELPSWLVLALVLGCAVALWWTWLTVGFIVVHSKVSEYATGYSPVKPPPVNQVSSENTVAPPPSERSAVVAEIGQAGDAFGAANALFAAIAGALVLWAGVLQSRSLREARRATKLATDAFREERLASKREHFASTFFQMLTLSRQLVERIEIASSGHDRRGAAALESLAASLFKRLSEGEYAEESPEQRASRIATTYVGSVYGKYPSALGPYFRLLFQTFKFVAEAEIQEDERIRFSNIARGQISEGAVMLLAANGLTERGHRFIPLIERFGLLEHLHPEYRQMYKQALLVAYRPRAFMGSEQRETEPLHESPLHVPSYFITWPGAGAGGDSVGAEPRAE